MGFEFEKSSAQAQALSASGSDSGSATESLTARLGPAAPVANLAAGLSGPAPNLSDPAAPAANLVTDLSVPAASLDGPVASLAGPAFAGTAISRAFAQCGAQLINANYLVEGLRMWARVEKWDPSTLELVSKTVEPVRLVNALAEQRFGAFKEENLGLALMGAGAVLGLRVSEVDRFFETASVFVTRIVGCRFEGRFDLLESLGEGQRLSLVPEPLNPVDSNAIRVATRKGETLGYVRRPIARRLTERLEKGAVLRARVALVLGPKIDANERLYIRVRVSGERRSVKGTRDAS